MNATLRATPKLLEFFGVLLPHATVLAALYNPANAADPVMLQRLRSESAARGISLTELAVKTPADLERVLSVLTAHHPDALQIVPDVFIAGHAEQIATFGLSQHLPTFSTNTDLTQEGVLLAYGPSLSELHRRAAYYVKRILNGANPGDLPVEQATRVGLVVNLKTAHALGLTLPATVLAQAHDVIE